MNDHDHDDQAGDARRCPHHPHVATSSPCGSFDAPCGECEGDALDELQAEQEAAVAELSPAAAALAAECGHCHGFGSSLAEPEPKCTRCGGSGLA